ncbi:MAG: hypothetical protein JWR69_502 [Pedosphaera sp.]|nr:hypothetical protein [Pedosphaera sp.]
MRSNDVAMSLISSMPNLVGKEFCYRTEFQIYLKVKTGLPANRSLTWVLLASVIMESWEDDERIRGGKQQW